MNVNIIILFLSLIISTPIVGQSSSFYVTGTISLKESGETLVGASVYNPLTQKGTLSDEYGRFVLVVPDSGAIQLNISYVGYQAIDTLVQVTSDLNLDIALESTNLKEVVVRANKQQIRHNLIQIPVKRLKAIPMLAGQPDLIKALAFFPGVNTGVEGTTGLYVRGGTPDQNLLLLDGATVYNSSHLFGFQSVFDPSAIKDIKFIKGGFPASYGGRLSSIIDITLKEGNREKAQKEFTLGVVNSGIMLEGPIKNSETSYMASGRAAYLGILLLPTYFSSKNKEDKPFNTMLSYDFNFKINHKFSEKEQIFASTYIGQDSYVTQYKIDSSLFNSNLGWGNQTASLRYIKTFDNRILSNTLLTYNHYQLKESNRQNFINTGVEHSFLRRSEITDWSLKQQLHYPITSNLSVSLGGEVSAHRFSPSNVISEIPNVNLDSLSALNTIFRPLSYAAYGAGQWDIFDHLTINAGLRYAGFQYKKNHYKYLEPRLALTSQFSNISINVSYDRMTQFIHLLANNSLGLTSDLWVPSTDKIAPQLAHQLSGGVLFSLPEKGIECSMEAYYKQMKNQIDYREGINFFDPNNIDWQNTIEKEGIGKAYGIEWLVKRSTEKFNGWLTYTLSWNERQFASINFGEWYPHKYDRRHNINLTLSQQLKNDWTIGANFTYQSGNRITLPQAVQASSIYDFSSISSFNSNDFLKTQNIISGRNNQQLPAYHRMDVSFTKDFISKKRQRPSKLVLSIYNVYGRKNPYTISISRYSVRLDSERMSTPFVRSRALFSFIPAVSYSVKW